MPRQNSRCCVFGVPISSYKGYKMTYKGPKIPESLDGYLTEQAHVYSKETNEASASPRIFVMRLVAVPIAEGLLRLFKSSP